MPTFTPPTVLRSVAPTGSRLYDRIKIPVSITVLKQPSGAYVPTENPTNEQINEAAVAYLGGRVYEVDAAEAASLLAAGYEVND